MSDAPLIPPVGEDGPLGFPCSVCGVPPGEQCRSTGRGRRDEMLTAEGRSMGSCHRGRGPRRRRRKAVDAALTLTRQQHATLTQARDAYRLAAVRMHDAFVGAGMAGMFNTRLMVDGIRLFDQAEARFNGPMHPEDRADVLSWQGRAEALTEQIAARDQKITELITEKNQAIIHAHEAESLREELVEEKDRPLFSSGAFILHSGAESTWKIDCDVLTEADLATLAKMAVRCLPSFGAVEGVPRGGLRLAKHLQGYVTDGPLLVVDDVITTGASMEQQRNGRDAIGVVIFARGRVPAWVTPLFLTYEAAESREAVLQADLEKERVEHEATKFRLIAVELSHIAAVNRVIELVKDLATARQEIETLRVELSEERADHESTSEVLNTTLVMNVAYRKKIETLKQEQGK